MDFMTPINGNALAWGHQETLEQIVLPYLGPDRGTVFEGYLSSAHDWFPMISKKLIRKELADISTHPEAGLTLLLVCMKLVTSSPGSQPAQLPLYLLAKSLCSAAEASGGISLRLVQSLTLLSLYEVAHSIYPGAFIDIGRAARLAALAGLSDRKSTVRLFKPNDTWTSREEGRRTWWAIFVLDRYINVEDNAMPFAMPEPTSDQLLPVNDDDWDNGNIAASEALYAKSFSNATSLGSFAKMCQAAYLLGKVGQHAEASLSATDMSSFASEALQLGQTLGSFHRALDEAELIDGTPPTTESCRQAARAICISAQFKLCQMYGCNNIERPAAREFVAEETEMQSFVLERTKSLALETVPNLARNISGGPLIARALYVAATECAWFIREDDESAMYVALWTLIGRLRYMGERWAVAGKKIFLLHHLRVVMTRRANMCLRGVY
jgi:hypothetical protein